VPQFETTQAQVPIAMLSGLAMPTAQARWLPVREQPGGQGVFSHGSVPQHGEQFDTWSARPERVFAPEALRAWLRDVPAGVLRLKGLVRTGERQWSEFQFAGRRGSLREAESPPSGPALVAIGLRGQLPVAALAALFDGHDPSTSVAPSRGSPSSNLSGVPHGHH
jgi:G3E family GTPase